MSPLNSSPNTWRHLARQPSPAPATSISKKRLTRSMLKKLALILSLCLLAILAFEIHSTWQNNPADVKAPVKDKPLKHITLRSNGVLDHAWAASILAIPPDTDMMALDITALHNRLLSSQQVLTASLARHFPDTLAITIEERAPVARLVIQQEPGGPREELLVATDGTVYAGANYPPQSLAGLPYLADVNLLRVSSGAHEYLPLAGIDFIARLVSDARINTPALYATWRSISLKRYDDDHVLIVRTNRAAHIIFTIREDFIQQLARLDHILDTLSRSPPHPSRGPVRTIDLSVGQTASGIQVPVTFYSASQ